MYVITGASGNTGSVVARRLLDSGKQVRVIARNAQHLRQFTERGAEAIVADITNPEALTHAFNGAEAVYAMIPPDPKASDVFAYDERVTSSLCTALARAGVRYAVNLSSTGAEKPSGTGLVVGLHRQEQALNQVAGLNVLHIRAGYFMENTLLQGAIIRATGHAAGPVREELRLPMIAARDIGDAAANALLQLDFKGHQVRDLLGHRDITYSEVTAIIGKAIGKPGLKYSQLSEEQSRSAMLQMGMSQDFVQHLLEMVVALNSGEMKPTEARSAQNSTPTSYEIFVAEKFVPAYNEPVRAA